MSRLRAIGRQHDGLDDLGLRDAVRPRLVADLLLHQWRSHVGRVDAVARDPVLGPLEGDHLAQPLEAVLGTDVGGLERAGPQPVHARDVHHAAPARRVHVRQHVPGQPERSQQHHRVDPLEDLGGELVDRAHVLDARVVDEHVDGGGQPARGVGVGEVGDEWLDATGIQTVVLEGGAHDVEGLPVEVEGTHLGAVLDEATDHGCADAAGGTGDEDEHGAHATKRGPRDPMWSGHTLGGRRCRRRGRPARRARRRRAPHGTGPDAARAARSRVRARTSTTTAATMTAVDVMAADRPWVAVVALVKLNAVCHRATSSTLRPDPT